LIVYFQEQLQKVELTLEQQVNAECGVKFPWKRMRLPNNLQPISYKLFLHPNLTTLDYTGHVEIDIQVINETNILIFHQLHLNVTYFSLKIGSQMVPVRLAICELLNQWAFVLDRKLQPQHKVRIRIEFNSIIPRLILAGFYANRHIDYEKNSETISAVTQFEPTHARRAFPCFDEPAFKAQFNVSIVREPHHVALSNMEVESSEPYDVYYVLDHFRPSLKMSTYILAFAVLDGFNKTQKVTKTTKKPVEINVFASTHGYQEQCKSY
jgi:aminopeptidase N